MTYSRDQTCFNRWDDAGQDGTKTAQIVRDVKQEIDLDILATKKPKWDASVGTIGNEKPEAHSETLFKIKRGLKDEKIETLKPKKVYEGIETRDAHYSGWNVSYETVHPRDSERFLQATRQPMLDSTKEAGTRLLDKSTKEYVTPEFLSGEISRQVR